MKPLVPAYFHPRRERSEWERMERLGPRVGIVVVNPDSGPGTGDPAYRAAISRLAAPVLGYVDTAYSARPIEEVVADAVAYQVLHGVTGVFADRVTADRNGLDYYAELAERLPPPLVLNPGVRPHQDYHLLADAVVTFEGDAEAHRTLSGRDPVQPTVHLVHGVGPDECDQVIWRSRKTGATYIYATDRVMPNPWDRLPTRWLDRR